MGTNCDFIEPYSMRGGSFYGGFSCPEAAKKAWTGQGRKVNCRPKAMHCTCMNTNVTVIMDMYGPESRSFITKTDGESRNKLINNTKRTRIWK